MRIPVGLVLFNPDIERLKENLNSIVQDAGGIFIVDNGSNNLAEIKKLLCNYNNIHFFANEKNEGIAKALNQLCEKALEQKYDYLITLDQDSVCPPNMIEEYKKIAVDRSIGLVCPVIHDRNHELEKLIYSDSYTELDRCITSASMVTLKAWKEVNGFDESMFIDGVDFDFCDRIRKKNYKIIRVNSVILLHEIGHIQVRKFLLWKVRVKNHPAFRKFYIARNTIYLARKQKSFLCYTKSYLQVLKQAGIVLLYETDKMTKLSMIMKGTIEGQRAPIFSKWIV